VHGDREPALDRRQGERLLRDHGAKRLPDHRVLRSISPAAAALRAGTRACGAIRSALRIAHQILRSLGIAAAALGDAQHVDGIIDLTRRKIPRNVGRIAACAVVQLEVERADALLGKSGGAARIRPGAKASRSSASSPDITYCWRGCRQRHRRHDYPSRHRYRYRASPTALCRRRHNSARDCWRESPGMLERLDLEVRRSASWSARPSAAETSSPARAA
jgi:hypothetical protein